MGGKKLVSRGSDKLCTIDFGFCSGINYLMIHRVSVPISVAFTSNHKTGTVKPQLLIWEGRRYLVSKIGFHHTFRNGRTLYHVFSVVSDGTFFKLVLNTENLFWSLEEISDGLPD